MPREHVLKIVGQFRRGLLTRRDLAGFPVAYRLVVSEDRRRARRV